MKKIITLSIACLCFLNFTSFASAQVYVEKGDTLSKQAYFQWGSRHEL